MNLFSLFRRKQDRVAVLKVKGDVAGLIRVLEHGRPNERAQAAVALGEIRQGSALAALTVAQKDRDPRVAAAAREAARRTVGFDPNVARAIKELEHHDPRVREKAARALGRSGHPKALEPLILLLDDPDTAVRLAALEATQRISDADFDGLDSKLAERLRRGPLTQK